MNPDFVKAEIEYRFPGSTGTPTGGRRMLESACIPASHLLGGAVVVGALSVALLWWAWTSIEVDPEGPVSSFREFEGAGFEEPTDVPMRTSAGRFDR